MLSCLKTCQNFSFHVFLGTVLFTSLNLKWSRVTGSGFEALKGFPWAETLPTSLQVFVAFVASLVLLWPWKPWASDPNHHKHHFCQLLISSRRS